MSEPTVTTWINEDYTVHFSVYGREDTGGLFHAARDYLLNDPDIQVNEISIREEKSNQGLELRRSREHKGDPA